MDNRTLKRFIRLDKELREIKAKMDRIKDQREEVMVTLLKQFEKAGMASTKADGMTVFIEETLWASAANDNETTCAALKAAGLGIYVKEAFNVQQLSAYVREQVREKKELPEALGKEVKVTKVFKLKTRKAGAK